MVQIKRICEQPTKDDGSWILVDRLWPRGVSKQKAKIDLWLRDVAPSNELRKWFGHNDGKWAQFKKKYADELKEKSKQELLDKLKQLEKEESVITFLFSAKGTEHNNAIALIELLKKIKWKKFFGNGVQKKP